jgi:hypothetical protein
VAASEPRRRALERIDDGALRWLAPDLIRIPSFTTEETDLFLCTRALALTALDAAL